MDDDIFYLVLPSNSSMGVYPDNKISNFRVQLPQPLQLDIMKWEVGLAEIQYPHVWYNIRKGKNLIIKEYLSPSLTELDQLYQVKTTGKLQQEKRQQALTYLKSKANLAYKEYISLLPGYYNSIEQILVQLRKSQRENMRPISFSYNPISRRNQIAIAPYTKLDFNNSDVGYCLGFHPKKVIDRGSLSDYLATTERYNSLYIYSDIIKNQNAGDVKAPLLRVVPVKSKYGEMGFVKYDRPYFMPISRSVIDSIEVAIKDEVGENVSFESGKAIITLVFRRKKARFYA